MHVCSYCGIEYDPSDVMCPACGHKIEKSVIAAKEAKKTGETRIKEEKKVIKEEKRIKKKEKKDKKEEIKVPVKKPDHPADAPADTPGKEKEKKEAYYKKALSRLEKSLSKGKEKTEKKEKKEKTGKKEKKEKKERKKEKSTPPSGGKSKKALSSLAKPFYFSKISYLLWFIIGFTILSLVSGYNYAIAGWLEKSLTLLFTSDISADAELLNVHHRINDLIPFEISAGSFFILNGDVLLFVPVLSCIIPLILWIVKKKSKGIATAGNSNVFTGLALSCAAAVFTLVILRTGSFNYTFFDIILAIALFAPILDMGVLVYAFKPGGFRLNQTIIVLLYNIGIPVLFIVISMAYDFISIFI